MTALNSARKAAGALLRIRTIFIAGNAVSAGAACALVYEACRQFPWTQSRPLATGVALLVGLAWSSPALIVRRTVQGAPTTVRLQDGDAPELALLVQQLALQLRVSPPAAIELSPGCDAWLDPRPDGTVLVIGSPFVWWLRVSELRGLLAPLVAGMAAAEDERVFRARRFAARMCGALRGGAKRSEPDRRPVAAWRRRFAVRLEARAELLERAVALEAVAAARLIEPTARAYAHEQINLAAAGWDRVLTRLARPAWESGLGPSELNVALVGALTSLGRRDRMAGAMTARLTEQPGCDLLEEPGRVDASVSRIAAEVFDGRRIDSPVTWERYIAEVAEPGYRERAAQVPPEHPVAKSISTLLTGGPVELAEPVTPAESAGLAGSLDPDAVAAYLACRLTDSRRAVWGIDWLDGPVLRDRHGVTVPVNDFAAALAEAGDASPLADWLALRR